MFFLVGIGVDLKVWSRGGSSHIEDSIPQVPNVWVWITLEVSCFGIVEQPGLLIEGKVLGMQPTSSANEPKHSFPAIM